MTQAAEPQPAKLPRSADSTRPVEDLVCPYPGLRPFTEQEERWYFGREAQRDECIQRLQQHRFLAVVGSSGSGKSSLVRAGLMPDLARGLLKGADERWWQSVMRPGADPLAALARAVQRLGGDVGFDEILRTLQRSKQGLVEAIRLVSGDRQGNVLLVIDQFEELFRLGKEEQTPERWHRERVSFVELVLEARESSLPIYLVLTMRVDFLEECTIFLNLPEALNAGQYLVPNLTRAQLELAIVTPAARLGIRLGGVLVRQILSDAAQLRDALPVVQHAIMRTWKHWQDAVCKGESDRETIDVEHYRQIGTARAALDRHGDEILEALGEADEPVVKLVFQRLTLTNADGKVTRSPTSFESLVSLAEANGIPDARAAVTRVLEAYRADTCRFLMPPADEALDSADIDISHEAVFRIWRKLAGDGGAQKGWVAEEHEHRRRYTRLMEAALLENAGEGQLLDDQLLADTEAWWSSFQPKLPWASRFHVLDKKAEAIVESAKARFHQLEREKRDDDAARDSVLREYHRELADWHAGQFSIAERYLTRSNEAKAAKVKEKEQLKLAKARAERKKWIWSGAAIALVVLTFVIFQILRINFLQGKVEAANAARTKAVADSRVAIEGARAAAASANEAQQKLVALNKKVADARGDQQAAESAAEDARKVVKELTTKLNDVNKDLADRSVQADMLRLQIATLQGTLKKSQDEAAKATLAAQQADRAASEAQRKLAENKKCLDACKNPFLKQDP